MRLADLFGLAVLAASALAYAEPARADAVAPSMREPRGRPCCAFAPNLAIDFGATHIPVFLRGVLPRRGLGSHSYLSDGELAENNGILYTKRGGFIDLGHTRDNADLTAYLALRLRPLLQRGEGTLELAPKGGKRRIVITARVPPADLEGTSVLAAMRMTFELSIWTELAQYYGLAKIRGAEEVYSSFTPEDLYSNLLGTYLGAMALASRAPYDLAMDAALGAALGSLGAASERETERIFDALEGRWWSRQRAWPSWDIDLLRVFDIGPEIRPTLAPSDIVGAEVKPVLLEVPETDDAGTLLASYCRLEIVPDAREMERYPESEGAKAIGDSELPRLVDGVKRQFETGAPLLPERGEASGVVGVRSEVAHYVSGLRLLELSGEGGIRTSPGARATGGGAGGGRITVVRGDTRGGDFSVMEVGALYAPTRGLVAGASVFRADALWFCRDPDTGGVRAPAVSVLGPCAPGEWIGLGGAVGEAFHDGDTGRTALRPIRLNAVVNPLVNGQSASYDVVRLLLHVGGDVDHVWTPASGGQTMPRAEGNVSFAVRSPARRLEARVAAGYAVDVGNVHDSAFESDLRFSYNFLLGGGTSKATGERRDAWGLAQLGVEGSYSHWTQPSNSYPELTGPFVSSTVPDTWQVLLTGALGFEGLTF
jgi:hypothetical protein